MEIWRWPLESGRHSGLEYRIAAVEMDDGSWFWEWFVGSHSFKILQFFAQARIRRRKSDGVWNDGRCGSQPQQARWRVVEKIRFSNRSNTPCAQRVSREARPPVFPLPFTCVPPLRPPQTDIKNLPAHHFIHPYAYINVPLCHPASSLHPST